MGMGGMTADAYVKYASVDAEKGVTAEKKAVNTTVAELRNLINPTTGYYDRLSAKSFVEDESIPVYKKIYAIFGKAVADKASPADIETMFAEIRKAVK